VTKHIHFGVTHRLDGYPYDVAHRIAEGGVPPFISDGDSFLEWGEGNPNDSHDHTLHVIYQWHGVTPNEFTGFEHDGRWIPSHPDSALAKYILTLRDQLITTLGLTTLGDLRVFDYVVVTDNMDWSEDQVTVTVDGTASRATQAVTNA